MPFPIRVTQVNGGSESAAAVFGHVCQHRASPCLCSASSPKLNGTVERANRTHTEEFYECYPGDFDLPTSRLAQLHWERL